MSSWAYIRENLQTKLPILKKQYPSVTEHTIEFLNKNCDPTKDKAEYTPWIVKMYAKNDITSGKYSMAREILEVYDRYKKANVLLPEGRDVNRANSLQELSKIIETSADAFIDSNPQFKAAKEKYPFYNTQIVNLMFADPTGKKGEYIPFLAKQMNDNKISRQQDRFFEDAPIIKDALQKFEFLKKRGLVDADINDLTLHDVFYYVEEFSQKKPLESELLDKMHNLIVGRFEDYIIYKIDKEHSYLLPLIAERTKWCVKQTTTTSSYFKFNAGFNFFLVVVRNNVPMFLIHYPTLQFKNALDEPMKQVELGRSLLLAVYDDIMQPWNNLINYYNERNINEKLNIPYIYNTTDAYIKHLCEKDFVIQRRLNVSNFRNGYPQIAFLWADFEKIMNAEEKALFKRQLKEYAQSVPERALTPFFDRYEKI